LSARLEHDIMRDDAPTDSRLDMAPADSHGGHHTTDHGRVAGKRQPRPAEVDAARPAALAWQVTLWSGEVSATESRAFERWYRADPAHELAWQQVQRIGQQLHAAPGALTRDVLRQARATQGGAASRRDVLRGLGLAIGTGVVGTAAWRTDSRTWHTAWADHRTGNGERDTLHLPDGTLVVLNTDSAIDVRYTVDERRIVLHAGEILIDTASDNAPGARPFLVDTPAGRVRALGTRFTVRERPRAFDVAARGPGVDVQVMEGAVALSPADASLATRIDAGWQARLDPDGVRVIGPLDPMAGIWRDGLLVVERWRLADVLDELGRYRPGVLRCHPSAADLVVSGVYAIDDTDAALQALAQALPVRIQRVTRYWVTVSAR
jgi:transmembrane sensor